MPSVGLTGNLGMGKTTVLRLLGKFGAYTFNVDKFVHETLKKPLIVKKIVKVLGNDVLKKRSKKISLDKKLVADIIFSNPQKRRAIEKIIHPEILKIINKTKSEIIKKNSSALIVFEVPLLFEAGYEKNFDKTVVVSCNRKTAINRLIKKGFSKDEISMRIRAQMPMDRKEKRADFIINNSNNIRKTELQVKRIFKELVEN